MKISSSGLLLFSGFNLGILNDKNEVLELSLLELSSEIRKAGYNCAETIFLSSIKYFDKPAELVSIASGFGGGIRMRDLCGFYTGGVMGIGLLCGRVKPEDREASAKCSRLTKEYTKWWKENFPLHCRDLKPEGATGDVCDEVRVKASEFLQSVFDRELEK